MIHFPIAHNLAFVFRIVVAHELLFAFEKDCPVFVFNNGSITRSLFLLLHFAIKSLDIDGVAVLATNKFSEIEWEPISIEKSESFSSVELCFVFFFELVHGLV